MAIEIDVTDFGAKGDGTTDDRCAIIAAIQAAQAIAPTALDIDVPLGGAVIRFPTPRHTYFLSQAITLPVPIAGCPGVDAKPLGASLDVNLTFLGNGTSGAWFTLASTSTIPYCFHVASPEPLRRFSFERLGFRGGGIFLEGPLRGGVRIADCIFTCWPEWAIRTPDVSSTVRDVAITQCVFSEGGPLESFDDDKKAFWDGGAILMGLAAESWRIGHCRFSAQKGSPVRISGRSCRISECDFEGLRAEAQHAFEEPGSCGVTAATTFSAAPFRYPGVHVTPASGGGIRITRCRFGTESFPARDWVLVGPLPQDQLSLANGPGAPGTTRVTDVQVVGCVFQGVEKDPKAMTALGPTITAAGGLLSQVMARSAVSLRTPTSGMHLVDSSIGEIAEMVREDVVADWSQAQADAADTPARDDANLLSSPGTGAAATLATVPFLDQGRGFDVRGAALRQRLGLDAPATRRGGNLLRSASALAAAPFLDAIAWTTLSVDVGVAPAQEGGDVYWTLTPEGDGAEIRQVVDATTLSGVPSGSAVLSFDLRAADKSARVSLAISFAGAPGMGAIRDFVLDDSWRRCVAVVERWPRDAASGAPAAVDVALRLQSHDVHARHPSFEWGDAPSPWSDSAQASTHAVRPTQSHVVGPSVMVPDPALQDGGNLTGLRTGDRVVRLAPTTGQAPWRVFDGSTLREPKV